jgi:hypothetical protein
MTADRRVIELTMPATTVADLQSLAEVLRGDEDDPLATLMQDALRTHLWIVRRQAQGRRVVALSKAVYAHLQTCPDIPDGKADLLPSWFLGDDEARP